MTLTTHSVVFLVATLGQSPPGHAAADPPERSEAAISALAALASRSVEEYQALKTRAIETIFELPTAEQRDPLLRHLLVPLAADGGAEAAGAAATKIESPWLAATGLVHAAGATSSDEAAGLLATARDRASEIALGRTRARALEEIAKALRVIDRDEEAYEVLYEAAQAADRRSRRAALMRLIAVSHAERGELDRAEAIAKDIPSTEQRGRASAAIVRGYARAGDLEASLRVARSMQTPHHKALALVHAARTLSSEHGLAIEVVTPLLEEAAHSAAEDPGGARPSEFDPHAVIDEVLRGYADLAAQPGPGLHALFKRVEDEDAYWAEAARNDVLALRAAAGDLDAAERMVTEVPPEERATLAVSLAAALHRAGRVQEATHWFDRARQGAQLIERPHARARAHARVAASLQTAGRQDDAAIEEDRAFDAARAVGSPFDRIDLFIRLSREFLDRGAPSVRVLRWTGPELERLASVPSSARRLITLTALVQLLAEHDLAAAKDRAIVLVGEDLRAATDRQARFVPGPLAAWFQAFGIAGASRLAELGIGEARSHLKETARQLGRTNSVDAMESVGLMVLGELISIDEQAAAGDLIDAIRALARAAPPTRRAELLHRCLSALATTSHWIELPNGLLGEAVAAIGAIEDQQDRITRMRRLFEAVACTRGQDGIKDSACDIESEVDRAAAMVGLVRGLSAQRVRQSQRRIGR